MNTEFYKVLYLPLGELPSSQLPNDNLLNFQSNPLSTRLTQDRNQQPPDFVNLDAQQNEDVNEIQKILETA